MRWVRTALVVVRSVQPSLDGTAPWIERRVSIAWLDATMVPVVMPSNT
jgi:hypothetical protein